MSILEKCPSRESQLNVIQRYIVNNIVVYEQIVNDAQPSWLSFIDNKGKLSNCFSINQLVGQNIILKKRTETSVKLEFFAIVLIWKSNSFATSDLSQIDSE